MHQLLYASSTALNLPDSVLDDILASARRNNARLGVTGMLLHVDGGFMQVLEGEAATLKQLYDRIGTDKRHWQPHILFDRAAPRVFGDWTMGFRKLQPDCAADAGAFQLTQDCRPPGRKGGAGGHGDALHLLPDAVGPVGSAGRKSLQDRDGKIGRGGIAIDLSQLYQGCDWYI